MTVDAATVGRESAPTANPVELVVAGAAGRMGTRIVALARESPDLRVAAEDTRFEFPEVRVGATVSFGGLYHLARIVGLGRCFELLYLADAFDAAEALRLGLVNRVVAREGLDATVRALAERIAGHFPLELALTRQALYRGLDLDFAAAVESETAAALVSYASGDRERGMAEALRRIREKRS